MDLGLTDHGVLVTGGGGGIGRAVARAFAAEGAAVAVHYRTSRAEADRVAADVGGVAIQADLGENGSASALVADAATALGRLDICVTCAGRFPGDDVPIWDLTRERWDDTIHDNLTTVFLTVSAFLRHAKSTGRGSVVLVGSTAGIYGDPGHADYSAAKAAVTGGLLPSLTGEAARIGGSIRVNAVAPGLTLTPKIAAAGVTPERLLRECATMPLKKLATPEDVASTVVLLASDRASGHVTGQLVEVTGGMRGRLVP